jgi:hypothetical protein
MFLIDGTGTQADTLKNTSTESSINFPCLYPISAKQQKMKILYTNLIESYFRT